MIRLVDASQSIGKPLWQYLVCEGKMYGTKTWSMDSWYSTVLPLWNKDYYHYYRTSVLSTCLYRRSYIGKVPWYIKIIKHIIQLAPLPLLFLLTPCSASKNSNKSSVVMTSALLAYLEAIKNRTGWSSHAIKKFYHSKGTCWDISHSITKIPKHLLHYNNLIISVVWPNMGISLP